MRSLFRNVCVCGSPQIGRIVQESLFHLIVAVVICSVGAAMSEPSNGISGFSLDLYEKCAAKSAGENVIISPFSVATALTLLSQATNGATFEELRDGLHLSGDKAAVANEFLQQNDLLKRGAGNATLSIANRIYVQQGHEIKKEFRDVAVKKFLSGIEPVNFSNKQDTAQTINNFVAEKTNNRIKDLIKPDSLNSDARVVLINAIHFKAEWKNKFKDSSTYKKDFYISDTEKVTTDFMNREEYVNYGSLPDLKAKALELKYDESQYSMIFILPDERNGLPALEAKLKNYNLTSIISKLDEFKVDISIPRFEVQYEVKLNDVLQSLKMGKIFALDADLKGLLESGESLQVSDVVHKAFIKVTEGGSEAAAATGLEVIPLSLILNQPTFDADHPFLYYIWDNNSKTPVFIGRLAKF